MQVRADFCIDGEQPKPVSAHIQFPEHPQGTVDYAITVQLPRSEIPADKQVRVHLAFNRYFIPREFGYAPDDRKLVIMAPTEVLLSK